MKERDLITLWLSWKKEREGAGFSQKQLAADAGISQTYLSNILTGIRNPGTKTLVKMAETLGLSMAEFYVGPPLVTNSNSKDSFPETDLDPSDSSSPTRSRSRADTPETIQYDDEEAAQPAMETIETDTDESPPFSISDYDGEPEKTGLALSDTTPDQLEKLFDSVGIPLADLFSKPTDMKFLKKSEQSKVPQEEESPQKNVRTARGMTNDQIPLLNRPPGGDFYLWLDSDLWEKHTPRISCCSVEGKHVFAIRVPDDSMEPDLHQSDILIINPDNKFIYIDGGIGMVVRNKRFYVRRIYIHKENYLLIPLNTAYKMETTPIEETRIYKVALWVPSIQRKF